MIQNHVTSKINRISLVNATIVKILRIFSSTIQNFYPHRIDISVENNPFRLFIDTFCLFNVHASMMTINRLSISALQFAIFIMSDSSLLVTLFGFKSLPMGYLPWFLYVAWNVFRILDFSMLALPTMNTEWRTAINSFNCTIYIYTKYSEIIYSASYTFEMNSSSPRTTIYVAHLTLEINRHWIPKTLAYPMLRYSVYGFTECKSA